MKDEAQLAKKIERGRSIFNLHDIMQLQRVERKPDHSVESIVVLVSLRAQIFYIFNVQAKGACEYVRVLL